MPNGTLISAAMPTMISVPRMALPKPPPSSKAAGGSDVKSREAQLVDSSDEEHVDHGEQRHQR